MIPIFKPGRRMTIKSEIDVVGQWIDSMADLVARHADEAGTNRQRVISYDRTTVTGLGRAFKAATQDVRFIGDEERARAGRHVYIMEEPKRWGLSEDRALTLAEAGFGGSVQSSVGTMLKPMQKLFETCKQHGIGVSVHTDAPGLVTVSLTPPPKPQPVLKPKPPKIKFTRGI